MVHFHIFIYLFIQIISLIYADENNSFSSYIIIKINGTGNQQIYNDKNYYNSYIYSYRHQIPPPPNEIYINGIIQSNITNYCFMNETENIIKLV